MEVEDGRVDGKEFFTDQKSELALHRIVESVVVGAAHAAAPRPRLISPQGVAYGSYRIAQVLISSSGPAHRRNGQTYCGRTCC
ncbi:hypothetical protein V1477_008836 [Vespula maculifrons]|uniref:Uncharacterized protein n=1 Tax=Vespula maculifrons TaxID=7453 RepID=A0ABD2CE45_VESMC